MAEVEDARRLEDEDEADAGETVDGAVTRPVTMKGNRSCT